MRRGHSPLRKEFEPSNLRDKLKLTQRECQVLEMVASGMNNREIGSALSITEGTVKVHVHHILAKLSVSSRTGAVREGLKRRLLSI